MTPAPAPHHLHAIEKPLYTQLGFFAIASLAVGMLAGGPAYGAAACAGVLAAVLYYMMLGVQVRRQAAMRHAPNLIAIVVSLLGRQIVCLAIPGLCYMLLGEAWWASLVTLFIARHWVMVVGWRVSALMQA